MNEEYLRLERYVLAALSGIASNAKLTHEIMRVHGGDPDKVNESIAQMALNVGARTMRATARASIKAQQMENDE